MDGYGVGIYLAILAWGAGFHRAPRFVREELRISPAVLALAAGLAAGRTGFQFLPPAALMKALPGVTVHVAILLGILGHRLGEGVLRLPAATVARRSAPPLGLALISLAVGASLLPLLLPDAEPQRPFLRFFLPFSFVLAVLPLLALRDLRGRPPADVGSLFLVAIVLVGAVHSFTPPLLWSRALDPGMIWRGPLLVLGESGALGVGAAVLHLLLVRRARVPRLPVAVLMLGLLAWLSFRWELWLPFAALGFGIALGRAGESLPFPEGGEFLFCEGPFVLLVALAFAPDLFFEVAAGPAVLHALALGALVVLVRRFVPGGRTLVTGPGLLFLGLALTVRLDRKMGPLTRYTVDFALPAWAFLRLLLHVLERRGARGGPVASAPQE